MTDSNKSFRARTAHLGFLALAGFIALAALVAIDLTSSSLPRSARAEIFGPGDPVNGCADPSGFGLDAWWRFENDFTDFTGNGHTGTTSDGISFPDGIVVDNNGNLPGNAAGTFDGSNDTVDVPDSSDWFFSTNSFTIDTWIYVIDQSGTAGVQAATTNVVLAGQVSHVDDPDTDPDNWTEWGFGIAGAVGNGVLGFGAQNNQEGTNSSIQALSGAITWLDGWNHVAVTFDTSTDTYVFYHNGAAVPGGSGLVDSDPVPNVPSAIGTPVPDANNWPLQIGGLDNANALLSTNTFFNGRIDELEISNGTALSLEDISAIAAGPTTNGFIPNVVGKCTTQIIICKVAQIDDGTTWQFDNDFPSRDADETGSSPDNYNLATGDCTDGTAIQGEDDLEGEGPFIAVGGHYEVTESSSDPSPSPQTLLGVVCTGSGDYALVGFTLEMDLVAGDSLRCTFLNGIRRVGDGTLPNEDLCDTMSDFCPTPTPTPTPTSTPVPGATATPTPTGSSNNIGGIFGGIIGQQPAGVRNQPTAVPATTAPTTISPPNTGDGGLR